MEPRMHTRASDKEKWVCVGLAGRVGGSAWRFSWGQSIADSFVKYEIATTSKVAAFGYIWLHLITSAVCWEGSNGTGRRETSRDNICYRFAEIGVGRSDP